MNPIIHTQNSIDKFGGDEEDFEKYLKIHEKMDCSKAYFSDNRHRALTHTLFWVKEVMIPLFGSYIILSNGNKVSVKDICEQHILEDFRDLFIPNVSDWLNNLQWEEWMKNGKTTLERINDFQKKYSPKNIKIVETGSIDIEKTQKEPKIIYPSPLDPNYWNWKRHTGLPPWDMGNKILD